MGTLWRKEGRALLAVPTEDLSSAEVKRLAQGRRVVWMVDDEARNRHWFVHHHSNHFCILTFSAHLWFRVALARGLPMNALVTDLFFPAILPNTDAAARSLLDIYRHLKRSRVEELPTLWNRVRCDWHLDGFTIARASAKRRPNVPIFLYSRKALLLLGIDDWPRDRALLTRTRWLVEKIDPEASSPAQSRRAAAIQRERILAALS